MKKHLFCLCLILAAFNLFAETYQISQINYETQGCGPAFLSYTKPFAIEKNVPVNKKYIFKDEDELAAYLKDYELKLYNLRAFESVKIDYTITKNPDFIQDEEDQEPSNQGIPQNFVNVTAYTKDSIHLLGVPYPKYNSNSGFLFKLKVKDTNFLGSLNTLSSEFNFALQQESENDNPDYKIGFTFAYDHPFHTKHLDFTWVNDYTISYTIGEEMPEWNAKTGIKIEYPSDITTFTLELYQKAVNNFDYKDFDDAIYFNEVAKFSVPFNIHEFSRYGMLKYVPYVDISVNWDYNYINEDNTDLSSPSLTFGHSLSLARVNWSHNFRDGQSAKIANSFSYNFQRQMFYPYLDAEFKYYKSFELFESKHNLFNRVGITSDLFAFIHFVDSDLNKNPYFGKDGSRIGERLRGIRDDQVYIDSPAANWLACRPTSAIVLNMDFPYHIFSTNFTKSFLKYLNFDFQLSPFFDMALTYNKATQKWFHPKDGFYAGGVEVLVYPAKWAGFTVRGSLGLDLGKTLFQDYLNTQWRQNVSKFELSFGIGLQY